MGNPTMTEELEQLLKNLKLRRMLEIYDEQLGAADKDDISYSEFVTRLVRAQFQARQEGALEWRIRRANLPERWSLETFPYACQPGVNRKQIRGFAELEFIAKAENIVLVGETARGKTGLACGLLLKALENGYRCQFIKAQNLFDEMYASLADRSTRQLLKRLARLDVLLVDELGYLNLKPEQSNIFFKLMEERYRQHSTIITTNLVYDEWPNFLGSRPMVEALLSRLRHYRHKVEECDGGRRPRPGTVHSPGSGGVPQNAGYDGKRPSCGPLAGRATLPTRRFCERSRKRIRAGSGTAHGASRRRPAVRHDSLAGLLSARDRGSARHACQPGILSVRTTQARTRRPRSVDHHAPLARMMEHQPRTPSAWIILPCSFHSPQEHACGVDDTPSDLAPVPSTVLGIGHFRRARLVYSC